MLYSEKDINFNLISDNLFEELCYDLLVRLGFQSLTWKQGPHDKGKDIEGEFITKNPLVGQYTEHWFFECKKYSNGVDKSKLSSAIDWADNKSPDHLVFFITPHVTNQCREWLDERQEKACYKIHLCEEKQLKSLILQYNELIERYFLNKIQRIFKNAFIDWVATGIFPGYERLSIFYQAIDPLLLTPAEMAFILTGHIVNKYKTKPAANSESFITQIIKRMYSIAENTQSYILNEDKINIQKIYSLTTADVLPFQHRILRTKSLSISYNRDDIAYKGNYHLIFNNEQPKLEVLLGQDISTDTIKTDIRLVRESQDTPKVITDFEEKWKKDFEEKQKKDASETKYSSTKEKNR